MKNIDINEWLLNNNIDPNTEIVSDGKQWFLSDILEKHLKEQFAIHSVVWLSEPYGLLHLTDWNGKCFKCGEKVFVREPK